MIAALEALRALLGGHPSLSNRVHIGDATGTLPPFAVVWSPQMGRDRDAGAAECGRAFSAQVGVTFTADTLSVALDLAEQCIELLTPGRTSHSHLIPGRVLWLSFFELRAQDIGRAVTLPEPDSHPASVVALFDLDSQPIKES